MFLFLALNLFVVPVEALMIVRVTVRVIALAIVLVIVLVVVCVIVPSPKQTPGEINQTILISWETINKTGGVRPNKQTGDSISNYGGSMLGIIREKGALVAVAA